VGVFWSFTASPSWQEVGQVGYLPNVAVTALGILTRTDSTKLLRASTYGRGVWEFPLTPDFSISISNTPMTVFPGQTPLPFTGTITALGGYNSYVDLSCTPSTCSIPPPIRVIPAPPPTGTSLSATVNGSTTPGDYSFDLKGSGEDPNHVTNDAAFTLSVVDFNLTPPSPNPITVHPGTTSVPVSLQVTAAGSFHDTVDLSCDPNSLPVGASCEFVPSTVQPVAGSPVPVTLSITAASDTAAGTYPAVLVGTDVSRSGAPLRTQNLSVTVPLDYSLFITNSALLSPINVLVDFDGVLTSLNGYNSPVNLSCGAGHPPTCSADPTPLTPTAGGATFKVTVSSNQCGLYNFNITATGTDSQATSHVFPVTFRADPLTAPTYTLEVTPASLTAPVTAAAIFDGTLTGTLCYDYPVKLSCGSGSPPTCSPSPATLTPTVSGVPFTVTVSSDVAQTYNFNISAVGTDPLAIQQAKLVTFTSTGSGAPPRFSFKIMPPTSLQSLPAGQQAVYDLEVKPSSGKFPESVALSSSDNCPALSTCSLSVTQVAKGSGDTHVTFTIATAAPILAAARAVRGSSSPIYALWLWLPGVVMALGAVGRGRKSRKQVAGLLLLTFIIPLLWLQAACGGGLQGGGNGQKGTPAGTYTMTITGTMTSLPPVPATITLKVN
jgi:hypothetical protein